MAKETERSTFERVAVVAITGIVGATVFVAPGSAPEPVGDDLLTTSSPSSCPADSARNDDSPGCPAPLRGGQGTVGTATDRINAASPEDVAWHGRHAEDCAKAAVAVNLDGVPFAVSGSSAEMLPDTGGWSVDVTLTVDGTCLGATKMAEAFPQIMSEFCEGIHNGTPDVGSTSLKVVAVDSASFDDLLDGADMASSQTIWIAYASVDMPSGDGNAIGDVRRANVVAGIQTIPVDMRPAGFSFRTQEE